MKDKTVVVTGAGSGIGRATALAFANQGARVAACDIDEARLATLAQELGDRALLVRKVDVADRAQMQAFADAVHALAPAADVVVNNAGVAVSGPFLETSLEDIDWLLGINLRGVIHGCKLFAPRMVDRRSGHIVNVSSIFGVYPPPNVAAYVASKFAVRGLSLSLRSELEPFGVGVTAICPGMIATEIVADGRVAGEMAARKSRIVNTFRERGAPPSKVAEAILRAVQHNHAVRPVGADAWAIYALRRVAPRTLGRIGASIQRRFAPS